MSQFLIETISKESLEQVKQLEKLIESTIDDVIRLNKEFSKAKVPSDITKGITSVNEARKKSNQTVSDHIKLQKKLQQSEVNRFNSLTKTNSQIIKNRVETNKNNRQTRQMAELNSKLTGEFRKQEIRLNQLVTRYKNLAVSEGKSSKEAQRLLKQINVLDKRLRSVSASAEQFQKNVDNYPKVLGNAANAAMNLARAMGFVGGAFLVAGTIRNAIKIFKDFDQSQADLAAILGKTREETTALTEQAKELGATTAFTATQVAELQLELSKLGFEDDDILAATRGVENLAIATGVDAARAAKLAGASIRGFNLEASEANRVAAALAVSTTKSASSFETLEVALPKVSAIANSFGFTIEDTTALLGGLQNAGFEASIAGTSLRQIFLQLADSNGKLAKRLGGGAKNFDELIEQFKKVESEGISLGEAFNLTNARSVAAFKTFLTGADDLKELRDSIVDVEDELTVLADTKLDSVQGRITLLNSAWEGWILNLDESGEASRTINRALDFLINNLSKILNTIVKLIKGFIAYKAVIIAVGLTTRLYTGLVVALRIAKIALAGGIGKATRAMKLFNATTKVSPLGSIATVIGLATAAFVAFKNEVNRSVEALKELKKQSKETTKQIVESNIARVKADLSRIDDEIDNEADANDAKIELLKDRIDKTKKGTIGLYDDIVSITKKGEIKVNDSIKEATEKKQDNLEKSGENELVFGASLNDKKLLAEEKLQKDLKKARTPIELPNDVRLSSIGEVDTSGRKRTEAQKKTLKELQSILKNLLKSEKNFNKQEGELSKKQIKQLRKDAFELSKFRLKNAIDNQKELRDSENESLQDRLEANRQVVALEKELAVLEKDFAISNAESRGDLITKIVEENQVKQTKATKEGEDKRDEIFQDSFDKKLSDFTKQQQEQSVVLQEAINNRTQQLLDSGASAEDIEKELTKFKRQELRKQLQDQIDFALKELETTALTADQKAEVAKRLTKLRSDLLNQELEENKERALTEQELLEERKQLVQEAFQGIGEALGLSSDNLADIFNGIAEGFEDAGDQARAFGQLATEVFSALTDASNARLEAEFENLEREKETALAFAGDSAGARDRIEEEFDQKQTALKRKQAKQDKDNALFKIAINTAVGVISALTSIPPNVPLSIAIGALGAIQLGVVASKQIPQFKDGVRGFEGGLAILGDGGVSEYARTPDGNVFKTPAKDTLYNLPSGTDVFKDKRSFEQELRDTLGENGINGYGGAIYGRRYDPIINVSGGITEDQLERVMNKTLAKQPVNNMVIDKHGLETYTRKGHTKTINLNNRVNFKSRRT